MRKEKINVVLYVELKQALHACFESLTDFAITLPMKLKHSNGDVI